MNLQFLICFAIAKTITLWCCHINVDTLSAIGMVLRTDPLLGVNVISHKNSLTTKHFPKAIYLVY